MRVIGFDGQFLNRISTGSSIFSKYAICCVVEIILTQYHFISGEYVTVYFLIISKCKSYRTPNVSFLTEVKSTQCAAVTTYFLLIRVPWQFSLLVPFLILYFNNANQGKSFNSAISPLLILLPRT
jgi:hypothetical protein